MPRLKSPIFKFSITNLILLNSVYPFDFFIRVTNFKDRCLSQTQSQISESEQYTSQDSPIIKANADECDEVFPWEFAVNYPTIKLEFIEICKVNKKEIIRSEYTVDETTEEEGKTVTMNANRSGKKLCIVQYILEPYIPLPSNSWRNEKHEFSTSQTHIKSSYSKSPPKESSDEELAQPNSESIKKKKTQNQYNNGTSRNHNSHKPAFNKKEHEELSKQIAQINKSIDKILDHEKSEHAIFSRYLDESTSFIKEIMTQSKASKSKFDAAYAELDRGLESHLITNSKQLLEEKPFSLSPLKKEEEKEAPKSHRLLESKVKPKDNEELAMESICQSELTDLELSSAKWYKEKYNKDKPQIYKNKNFRVDAPGPDANYEISLKYSDSSDNQNSMIFSDLEFNTEIKPNEISFIDPHSQSILFKAESTTGPSYDWKKSIEIPKLPAVIISVKDEFCKQELSGCIAKRELEKMRVSLYDKKGEEKGQMKFKNRTIGFCSVQTQQMLNVMDKNCEDEIDGTINDVSEIEMRENQKEGEGEEQDSVESKEEMEENSKPAEETIKPNQESSQQPSESCLNELKELSPKENDFEKLLIYESDVRTVTNKSEDEPQNIQESFSNSNKLMTFLPHQIGGVNSQISKEEDPSMEKHISKTLNTEPFQSHSNKERKRLNSLEAVLKSRKNSLFEEKETKNEIEKDEKEEVYVLHKTEEKPSKKPSRLRRHSVENSRVSSRNIEVHERQELENKEENKEIHKKLNSCNIVSNSVSVSYLPFQKKQTLSQKYPESSFISDEEMSEVGSSNQLSGIKGVSFKIDSISMKIYKNTNDFHGKFVKISMRNRNPYLTETINLTNNLTWKGKGYIFDNVSPYGELILELYNDDHNNPVVLGKARICLALLNLDKHNIVQFHHDFVRNENEQQIGEIVLGYERIDKNRKTLSVSHKNSKEEELFPHVFEESIKKRKRKATSREKAGSLREEPTNRTEKKKTYGIQASQVQSIIGAASVIRTKKYTGGNIIIGRAARFRTAPIIKKPGPGDYELKSSFEKHISPL